MKKNLCAALAVGLLLAASASAQNTNSGTTTRTTTTRTTTTTQTAPRTAPTPATGATQEETTTGTPAPATSRGRRATPARTAAARAEAAASAQVRAAFDALIDGITRADVDAVMDVYWNSPQLLLFNYNGTTTRTWAQVRANRESSYPNIKDAKVAVRDVRVQMLGPDAALVTALWTQAQTFKGQPENSSGRLTLVFRRVGTAWKAVHTHTSPDAPDPSRVPPSEQQTETTTTTTTTPTRPAAKP